MNGIVAYSQPRGKYGRYVFTIVLYFTHLTENETIEVTRPTQTTSTVYSCNYCGRWAEVTVTVPSFVTIDPTQRTQGGKMVYYRYDDVEPGDKIIITLRDDDLIFYQTTQVSIAIDTVSMYASCSVYRQDLINQINQKKIPQQLFDIFLINWDKHVQESAGRTFRVEEDLINKTMNAEKFEIKELLLQPAKQPIALENGQRFIEGELKYLD